MSTLCNDNSKETNAYHQFLTSKRILVLCIPSRFLSIIAKYKDKKTEQSFKLFVSKEDSLRTDTFDAVFVDNTMPEYYAFAKDIKPYILGKAKFFVLVDNKYITDLKVVGTSPKVYINKPRKTKYNGKRY